MVCHTLRGCVDWNIYGDMRGMNVPCHTLRGCVDWNETADSAGIETADVTPCVGVWIETSIGAYRVPAPSHTLRGCVDWNSAISSMPGNIPGHTLRGCVDWNLLRATMVTSSSVTPCVGVWIETPFPYSCKHIPNVTPCVGVWIETLK